MAKNFT